MTPLYNEVQVRRRLGPNFCGADTEWGCGLRIEPGKAHAVTDLPIERPYVQKDGWDNQVRLFHAMCSPAVVAPESVRRGVFLERLLEEIRAERRSAGLIA